MIIHGKTLISESLFETHFVCNTVACKGACCVQGDAGAPVEADEIEWIKANLVRLEPYLDPEAFRLGSKYGFFSIDFDDKPVTACLPSGECVFLKYENGVAKCGIEKAFYAEGTEFKKPVSCHLYPIRLSKVGEYEALNYHQWDICSPALKFGSEFGTPLFRFLKEPLIRKYGQTWYEELEEIYAAYRIEKSGK